MFLSKLLNYCVAIALTISACLVSPGQAQEEQNAAKQQSELLRRIQSTPRLQSLDPYVFREKLPDELPEKVKNKIDQLIASQWDEKNNAILEALKNNLGERWIEQAERVGQVLPYLRRLPKSGKTIAFKYSNLSPRDGQTLVDPIDFFLRESIRHNYFSRRLSFVDQEHSFLFPMILDEQDSLARRWTQVEQLYLDQQRKYEANPPRGGFRKFTERNFELLWMWMDSVLLTQAYSRFVKIAEDTGMRSSLRVILGIQKVHGMDHAFSKKFNLGLLIPRQPNSQKAEFQSELAYEAWNRFFAANTESTRWVRHEFRDLVAPHQIKIASIQMNHQDMVSLLHFLKTKTDLLKVLKNQLEKGSYEEARKTFETFFFQMQIPSSGFETDEDLLNAINGNQYPSDLVTAIDYQAWNLPADRFVWDPAFVWNNAPLSRQSSSQDFQEMFQVLKEKSRHQVNLTSDFLAALIWVVGDLQKLSQENQQALIGLVPGLEVLFQFSLGDIRLPKSSHMDPFKAAFTGQSPWASLQTMNDIHNGLATISLDPEVTSWTNEYEKAFKKAIETEVTIIAKKMNALEMKQETLFEKIDQLNKDRKMLPDQTSARYRDLTEQIEKANAELSDAEEKIIELSEAEEKIHDDFPLDVALAMYESATGRKAQNSERAAQIQSYVDSRTKMGRGVRNLLNAVSQQDFLFQMDYRSDGVIDDQDRQTVLAYEKLLKVLSGRNERK